MTSEVPFRELDLSEPLPIYRADELPELEDCKSINRLDPILPSNIGKVENGINNISNKHNSYYPTNLPKPSFRPAQNKEYKRRHHTLSKLRTTGYYHYQEPKPEELFERVEYDMDLEDMNWLELFNQRNKDKFNYEISDECFEKIIDRLEKESYFESRTGEDVDDDAVCAICNDGDCHNANVILFCDMCDLAVHQECYGVPYIPEGQWLCRRCLQSPMKNVSCVLCPNTGGAFKQTDDGRWAHVICALWIPEVCFANTVFLEPIDSINNIPAARWKLTCYICKQKRAGACIQCNKQNCFVPFHVTCAQEAQLYMKIKTCRYDTPEGQITDVKKEAYCDVHKPADGNGSGGGMYSGDEIDEEILGSASYKKWNRDRNKAMKKTRKVLEEKRKEVANPTADVKVTDEKLEEISKLLTIRGKRKPSAQFDEVRKTIILHIQTYWQLKRQKRNGVPLLRRLQASYINNASKQGDKSVEDLDKDRYTRLRYDLEKARLLIGEVQKREYIKKKLFTVSRQIVEKKFALVDKENPPEEK